MKAFAIRNRITQLCPTDAADQKDLILILKTLHIDFAVLKECVFVDSKELMGISKNLLKVHGISIEIDSLK